jgi:hypothetical protein
MSKRRKMQGYKISDKGDIKRNTSEIQAIIM